MTPHNVNKGGDGIGGLAHATTRKAKGYQAVNLSPEQTQALDRLYAGTLVCPYPGCYEKDPVRYLDRTILAQHTRHGHGTYMDVKSQGVVTDLVKNSPEATDE